MVHNMIFVSCYVTNIYIFHGDQIAKEDTFIGVDVHIFSISCSVYAVTHCTKHIIFTEILLCTLGCLVWIHFHSSVIGPVS